MNLYDASVPVFITMLENLAGILAKAEAWATENGKSDEDVLQARLAPDMFPLVKQVQIVSDNAKSISARLAGEEPPKMEDTEVTFVELIERARKTVVYLQTLNREKFEGAEKCHIPYPYVPDTYLLGHEALLQSYLPNFFFHATTAYAILRNQGVPLGKADFIGALPLKPNAQ
jgi:hypothetical protein